MVEERRTVERVRCFYTFVPPCVVRVIDLSLTRVIFEGDLSH